MKCIHIALILLATWYVGDQLFIEGFLVFWPAPITFGDSDV